MDRLIEITSTNDIKRELRNTPIGKLLEYHNLGREFGQYENAQLLIGTCIDFRVKLNIPDNFAYVIRTAGANLQNCDFNVSFPLSIGRLNYLALIGHTDCGMAKLSSLKDQYIEGMIDVVGWDKNKAEESYFYSQPKFEIGNVVQFILNETARLRKKYPNIVIAPLLYSVDDRKLNHVLE